jgi:hypothetical protein
MRRQLTIPGMAGCAQAEAALLTLGEFRWQAELRRKQKAEIAM